MPIIDQLVLEQPGACEAPEIATPRQGGDLHLCRKGELPASRRRLKRRDGDVIPQQDDEQRNEAMTDKKLTPDWERIELDYRAGVKTLRQIAEEHGISHVAINKRAKRDGWSRDLSAKIAAKAEELVTRRAVTNSVTKTAAERDVVAANAQLQADAVLSQREDVRRGRRLVMSLFEELEHETEHRDLYLQLGELMQSGDDASADKLNDIYRKVISLPQRIDGVRKLSESLRIQIELERKVLNIDERAPQKPETELADEELEARLSRLLGKAGA